MPHIYPEASPHGEIEQIFPNIFMVKGSIQMGPGLQISRNMIILRHEGQLTLVSAIRLNEQGLKQLSTLGEVKHIVRLGAYHLGHMNGVDDEFYLDYFDAKLWLLPGMKTVVPNDKVSLMTKANLPIPNIELFVFDSSPMPEGILSLTQGDGVIITADSLQNWRVADEYFSPQASAMLSKAGFIKPANIGPEWRRANSPSFADFKQVKRLRFKHLLPSHGTPLLNTAKQEVNATIAHLYCHEDNNA
ncbi:hypothetical protein [Pseudoalteromonas luteoviolacea]|uniref:Metallo-beta-lactamase domain-containing protein n=1 Tax=Pseudoalteromonas luteoviolacea (strain 2ta16) TaxID=1353533 RepID=V4HNS2_PSEL2|nr:hypothetical protein [Pseudoalteromonas luteoviolacea]ESP91408.1 hypothetical protein PL2TA16_00207 [Pseudoalteromonas luteoviolacea 2ta16]KZN40054.1 hypothetical protein N483_17865 [Pseudoalteromonas luteoviolacea NCIMB 1944]